MRSWRRLRRPAACGGHGTRHSHAHANRQSRRHAVEDTGQTRHNRTMTTQSAVRVTPLGRPAREVRDPQHVMVVDRATFCSQPRTPVRRAWRGDIDALINAAAAMHREEMGVDPLSIDAPGWRARMTTLVDRGWSWVWTQ